VGREGVREKRGGRACTPLMCPDDLPLAPSLLASQLSACVCRLFVQAHPPPLSGASAVSEGHHAGKEALTWARYGVGEAAAVGVSASVGALMELSSV